MDTPQRSPWPLRDLLGGLAPRQRLVLVSIPLLVLALLGFVAFDRKGPSDEALLAGKDFNGREMKSAQEALRHAGLTRFRIEGRRILAPRAELERYNAALSSTTHGIHGGADGLEKALTANSWSVGGEARQEWIEHEKGQLAAAEIRRLPQIEDARIVCQRSRPKGFSRDERRTATLFITPGRGAELPGDLYRSLQQTVGSALNLAAQDVTIFNTATGRAFPEREASPIDADVGRQPRSTTAFKPDGAVVIGNDRIEDSSRSAPASARRNPVATWAVPFGSGLALAALLWTVTERRKQRLIARSDSVASDENAEHIAGVRAEAQTHDGLVLPTSAPLAERTDVEFIRRGQNAPVVKGSYPLPEEANSTATTVRGTSPTAPFDFLRDAEPDVVLSFVSGEHPQTIALILSHLPAPLAAEIVRGLPSTSQFEVVSRVATLDRPDPQVVEDVAMNLRDRLANHQPGLHRSTANNRGLRLTFAFDDLLNVPDDAVPKLFARLDSSKWALALAGANDELRSKFMNNLPPLAVVRLQDELHDLGPVRVGDIAAAQQQIVDMVRRLEDAGEIASGDADPTLRTLA